MILWGHFIFEGHGPRREEETPMEGAEGGQSRVKAEGLWKHSTKIHSHASKSIV